MAASTQSRRMISKLFFHRFNARNLMKVIVIHRNHRYNEVPKVFYTSSSSDNVVNRDPGPLFINPKVQEVLERLTGMNFEKIYEFKPSVKRTSLRYEFMTEERLQKALEDTKRRAKEKLQMPPVLKEREPINETIAYDPELKGHDTVKYVFVDISYGIPARKRHIVVRDVDGTLRKASWEERDRMIETFFPVPMMKRGIPRVFIGENLTKALDEHKYKFLLDRACLQFEPDHPTYINVCHMTYEHIDENKNYDVFHSTRHYGPMVFHFAFNKRIDNILEFLIQKDRINESADVVRLYHMLNPDCKSIKLVDENTDPLTILKAFAVNDAIQRSHLELTLQTYEELMKQQKGYLDDLKKAHGQ